MIQRIFRISLTVMQKVLLTLSKTDGCVYLNVIKSLNEFYIKARNSLPLKLNFIIPKNQIFKFLVHSATFFRNVGLGL